MTNNAQTLIQQYYQHGGQDLLNLSAPVIHAPVQHTEQGTPYLTTPGVVMLAQPRTNLAGMAGFLAGYGLASHFGDYLDDPTELSDSAQLCKVAGQLCYMSFGRQRTTNAQAAHYFDNLKASGHGSVFEHATFSFLFYGISRSVTHELVRHRHLAFSQQSQRYVSGRMVRFVERPEYTTDKGLHAQFLQRIDRAAEEYAMLTERIMAMQQQGMMILSATERTDLRKKVQQTARSVLPNETEAPIIVTGNVRAWRHIVEMRASTHAETEIRALAIRIFLCLAVCEPLLFSDYALEELPDGTIAVKTPYAKI